MNEAEYDLKNNSHIRTAPGIMAVVRLYFLRETCELFGNFVRPPSFLFSV